MTKINLEVLDDLSSIKGVFSGLYRMFGPFAHKEAAERFLKDGGLTEGIFVKSNKFLYIPTEPIAEVKNDTHDTSPELTIPEPTRTLPPTYPKPKPETVKQAGRWVSDIHKG